MPNQNWKAGEEVVVARRQVLKIDRVTPTGRAVIGKTTFDASGRERGAYSNGRLLIERPTPELLAIVADHDNAHAAWEGLYVATSRVRKWAGNTIFPMGAQSVPTTADYDIAARIVAAINEILGDK